MGCIHSNHPSKPERFNSISIADNSDFVLNRKKEYQYKNTKRIKTVKTPTCYLLNEPIYNPNNFIKIFVDTINNKMYNFCSFNEFKDLFFCDHVVYSVEIASYVVFESRIELFKKVKTFQYAANLLIPYNIHYIPLENHKGIIVQDMEYCDGGDLHQYIFGESNAKLDIHQTVNQLASTLKECHKNNIFLGDIKLENIFITNNRCIFADYEYALHKRKFLTHKQIEDMSDIDLCKYKWDNRVLKWVRTLDYCPDKEYPFTRDIAQRNDTFALAKSLGSLITVQEFKYKAKIFASRDDRTKEALQCIKHDKKDLWEYPYIQILGECMLDYESVANESFLNDLITISFTHL